MQTNIISHINTSNSAGSNDSLHRRLSLTDVGKQQLWATALYIHINGIAPADDLDAYRDTLHRAVVAGNGHVRHQSQDTLVALFGVPTPMRDHAQRGVDAAVAIMDELAQLNEKRQALGKARYRVGIGVNTGCLRSEDTVPTATGSPAGDDSITTAKELSTLNKQTPFYAIFISKSTLAEMSRMNGYHVDNLGQVGLADEAVPLTVYALMHAEALQLA